MISVKLASLSLLKIKVFWNKGYDIIISTHDVTNKTLLHESNYKFGNSITFMKVINTFGQFDQKDLTRKTNFWGVLLAQVQ